MLLTAGSLLMMHAVQATVWIVNVANTGFFPSNVGPIAIGDSVRWEWKGANATTTSTTIPSGAAAWSAPINAGNTSFSYQVTVPGIYNYANANDGTQSGQFLVVGPTGVGNAGTQPTIVFPSVVVNALHVSLAQQACAYTIVSLQGAAIGKGRLAGGMQQIDVSNLPTGAYLLKIVGSDAAGMYRFIKL